MKLIIFEKDLVVVEKNNKWYIPSKIYKLNPKMKSVISEKSPECSFEIKTSFDTIDEPILQKYEEKIIWSPEFDMGFAYIPETGILGVI